MKLPTKGTVMAHENRRFSRIQSGIEAQMMADNHQYRTTQVINLGIGGCLLGITADLKPGAACSLKFVLGNADDGPEIRVEAEVIRCQPEGIALRFTEIDSDSLFHLQNLVRYNSEDPEAVEQEIREHPGLV
jgi:hypothetical protein